ncbi:hypothetical protein H7J74_06155, partial [Mycobacterium angelicum]|nr:hypothetical protein [Mycobacterium angelicum]
CAAAAVRRDRGGGYSAQGHACGQRAQRSPLRGGAAQGTRVGVLVCAAPQPAVAALGKSGRAEQVSAGAAADGVAGHRGAASGRMARGRAGPRTGAGGRSPAGERIGRGICFRCRHARSVSPTRARIGISGSGDLFAHNGIGGHRLSLRYRVGAVGGVCAGRGGAGLGGLGQ